MNLRARLAQCQAMYDEVGQNNLSMADVLTLCQQYDALCGELAKALNYVRQLDEWEMPLGTYEGISDLGAQITYHKCAGCKAEGVSQWPKWELKFEHEKDCEHVLYKQALAKAKDAGVYGE